MAWDETELERRRFAAKAAVSRRGRLAGLFGVITGLCAFIPGFGIILGLLSWRFVEIPLLQNHEERLCAELVGIYLPEADTDQAEEIAGMLAGRRDPNRTGAARVADAVAAVVMNPMRNLESGALRKLLELLGKILLPFGIGAAVGFAVDYYEMRRLGRWAGHRLEALAGVPEDLQEPYTDTSGWFACGCVTVLAAALAATVIVVVMLVRWLLDWVRPLLEWFQRLL